MLSLNLMIGKIGHASSTYRFQLHFLMYMRCMLEKVHTNSLLIFEIMLKLLTSKLQVSNYSFTARQLSKC
jgi:hypothetical protein